MTEASLERKRQRVQWTRFALGTLGIILIIFFAIEWIERTFFTANENWWTSFLHLVRGFVAAVIATAFATFMLLKRARQAERRASLVEESMENVFQIMDVLPTGVMVIDREGRPFYANQAAEQLLGQGLASDATPERMPAVYNAYVAGTNRIYPAERMPLYRALKGEREATVDDVEIRNKDKRVPLRVVANPTEDEGGRIHHAVASLIDLSQFETNGHGRGSAPRPSVVRRVK